MGDNTDLPADTQAVTNILGRLVAILQIRDVISDEEAEFIRSGDREGFEKLKETLSDEEIQEIIEKYGDRDQ